MKQTLKIGDKVKHDCLRDGFHMIKSKTGICTICGAYFPEHDLDKTKKVKKYKYTRKECNKEIETIKRIFSGSQIMPGGWLETVTQYLHATQLMLLAQKEDKKECCGGHSNGKSTYVDNMAKIYGVKVKHPTPSPLEIEEIEEYFYETSYDRKILNKLIRNQKKLYQLIKEKL